MSRPKILEKELTYWLALWRQPSIGPKRFQKLLSASENKLSVFFESFKPTKALRELLSLGVDLQLDWDGAQKDLDWLNGQPNHHIITCLDPLYPPLLKQTTYYPPLLFIKGNVDVLRLPQVGMVGSRHPTITGLEDAAQFAKGLVQNNFIVTSGLAMGIDAASHRGALNARGKTIAVLGHGLDQVYPRVNQKLAKDIIQDGALVSEFPIGVQIKREFFPRRNRIISGLSLGVLVVEATLKSGSLITAKYAAEQGREVFAMPGSIHNPLAKGCHSLIREGAKCVETIEHLVEEFQSLLAYSQDNMINHKEERFKSECKLTQSKQQKETVSVQENNVLPAIGYECTPIDLVIERTGLSARKVTALLLDLELKGMVAAIPGGYIRNTTGG